MFAEEIVNQIYNTLSELKKLRERNLKYQNHFGLIRSGARHRCQHDGHNFKLGLNDVSVEDWQRKLIPDLHMILIEDSFKCLVM